MDVASLARRSRIRWIVAVAGVIALGFGGYLGFVAFVENGSLGGLGAGVMGVAIATGFAAFFSPCSFPLLVTFLVRQSASSSRTQAARSSLIVGLGAIAFFALLAIVLALVGEGLGRLVGFDTLTGRVFRALLGGLLVLLGLRQAGLIKSRIRLFDSVAGVAGRAFDGARFENPTAKDFAYGFGYVLAGFG